MSQTVDLEEKVLRQAWVEVDLDAIEHNIREIKKYIGDTELLVVVKADAYGLGAVQVSRLLAELGVDRLGVVLLDEAIELRRAGIKIPIVNMGPILPHHAKWVVDYDIEQMVFRENVITAISSEAKRRDKIARLHLKIDTGMSRYGVPHQTALDFYVSVSHLPNLEFVGVMSHFAMSDALDKSYARLQLERFSEARRAFQDGGDYITPWHISNSGGMLDMIDAHLGMVRVGLTAYGYFPSEDVVRPFELKPAMSVRAKIVAERTVQRGDSVGYGRRYIADKTERIGILPIGYADGYNRKLRDHAYVLNNGKIPVVGGLCMDACFVNLTEFPHLGVGDTVTLMGGDLKNDISPHDIAAWIGSVSYEVMSGFGRRLARVFLRKNRIQEIRNTLID